MRDGNTEPLFRTSVIVGIVLAGSLITLWAMGAMVAQGSQGFRINLPRSDVLTRRTGKQVTHYPDSWPGFSGNVLLGLPLMSRSGSANYPNCRFGVGGNVSGFNVATLDVGWHMDWSAQLNPPRPNGAEYVQVVRLKPELYGYSFTPITNVLLSMVDADLGAVWMIGNEPDSPFQDKLWPEEYARAYHHLYYLIKERDPSARIGAGSIVQPTPLRFQYLDRFLAAYRQYYGEQPPVDLWSIHSYILREIDAHDPDADPNGARYSVWGAYVPPGFTATRGVLYTEADMFSTMIFRQRLIDFRTWMRDQGYRDKPLYITEYGELFPYPPYILGDPYVDKNGVPITEGRVAAFMTSTFDILLNLTDAAIGYPADANRLVQRWLWYSVSDAGFGGLLFDPSTHERLPLGNVFYSYTQAISSSVDLLAVRVVADPAAISDTGQLQMTTLKATISNIGSISITKPITVVFYSGQPPTGTLIGMRMITSALNGCAATAGVSLTWPNLYAGAHPMYIEVDPGDTISETSKVNNTATGFALIATQHVYLPTIAKNYSR